MELLTPDSVAQQLFTTTGTLAKWRLRGCGPRFVRIVGGIAYPKDELEGWLKANLQASTSGGGKGGRRKREPERMVPAGTVLSNE